MYYVYESCLGTIYYQEMESDDEELKCNICGDYDELLGTFETEIEAQEFAEKHEMGDAE